MSRWLPSSIQARPIQEQQVFTLAILVLLSSTCIMVYLVFLMLSTRSSGP